MTKDECTAVLCGAGKKIFQAKNTFVIFLKAFFPYDSNKYL